MATYCEGLLLSSSAILWVPMDLVRMTDMAPTYKRHLLTGPAVSLHRSTVVDPKSKTGRLQGSS